MDILVNTSDKRVFFSLPSQDRCYHSEALVWIHKLVLEHKLETPPSLIPELSNSIIYLHHSQYNFS